MRISEINLKIIKDSRGEDTLEAVMTSGDLSSISSVPAGKSKGRLEMSSIAPSAALRKLEEIKGEILNADFSQVLEFDNFLKKMDGTPSKSNLGGNLILVLSICFTKLFAKFNNLQTYQLISKLLGKIPAKFPFLFFNLIGGGLHAKDSLPFQEYLLVAKFDSPLSGLEYAKLIIEKLKLDIAKNYGEARTGDEGAYIIKSSDPSLGLEVLTRNLGNQDNICLALDAAASTFYKDGIYKIGEKALDTAQMLDYYQDLAGRFSLLSIEDPFSEDDRRGFAEICKTLRNKVWIIGDDLTVTNKDFIRKANDEQLATGVIIKPNQIGSVSETLGAIGIAQSFGWKIIVSNRSGETYDDFIADLAFGSGADGLKSGSPVQPQRLAKYNRLIEIEREVNR